jgi:hypothetical protein
MIYALLSVGAKYIAYALPIVIIALIYLTLFLPIYLLAYDTPIALNYVLYRSPTPPSPNELTETARLLLVNNLLHIYWQSPLFGVGSFDLYSYFPNAPSHSESKWLSLLASYGITAVIIFMYFYKEYVISVKYQNWYKISFLLSVIIYSTFYGSFINTYNFIFLFLLGASNIKGRKAEVGP